MNSPSIRRDTQGYNMHSAPTAASKLAMSLRPLFAFGWRMLLTLTVSRFIFVAWQWRQVADADMFETVLLQGLRFDLLLLGLMLSIPALLFPLLASNHFLVPAWRALLKVILPVGLLIIVIMECSTPSFVDQFDSRPNMLIFEYLNHPLEVAATLWAAYKLPIVLTLAFVTIMTWANSRHIGRLAEPVIPTGFFPAIVMTPLLLLLCFGLVRSTIDSRPVKPAAVALSDVRFVAERASSSTDSATNTVPIPRRLNPAGSTTQTAR